MLEKLLRLTISLIFSGVFLFACSDNPGGEPEKGAIRKMTDQVADDLVHKIRDPIDKARSVKDREDNRVNDLGDTAAESSRVD